MPQHRNEPLIYSGSVFITSGSQAGMLVPTPYKVAQGLVMNGQARWEDDPAPMPRQLAGELARREEEKQRAIAEDTAASLALAGQPSSLQSAVVTGARPIPIETINDVAYLTRPFPQIAEIVADMIAPADQPDGIYARNDNVIAVRAANASAVYEIVAEEDGFLYCSLTEAETPGVEIRENWRDRNHLVNIPAAKKIRGLDSSEKLPKAEAEAIIEEWTKDDQVPEQEGADVPRNENGRIIDGSQAEIVREIDGELVNAKSPEEIARENERRFLDSEDGA